MSKLLNYLITIDHKIIGVAYIFLGIFLGFIGTSLSSFIRVELLVPSYLVFSGSASSYNVVVTSHGVIMVFFAAMPIFISGFGNLLIPLMIGCRDMGFPLLNNIAFYVLLLSFFSLTLSNNFFGGGLIGASCGWTLYPPFSTSCDILSFFLMIVSLHINGISSLINAVNALTTIHFFSSIRTNNCGLFVWSLIFTSYLLVLVIPVLVVALTALLTDNILSTCFFSFTGGGDPLLFQHLFWFFGHPEVYIVILPAFGLVSEIISDNYSSKILGHKAMIWSMAMISVLGCIVWGHHMFTTGLEVDSKAYFTLATSLIALPTGLKIFIWLSNVLCREFLFNIPMCFSVLFITTFIIGGLTGIWLAQAGLDLLLHDSYFVIAHFHYVMAISLVYIFFSGFYKIFKTLTGSFFIGLYARIHLVTFFLGTNMVFMPMHFLGISGMPRRVFDYPTSFVFINQVSSLGLVVVVISLLWFIISLTPGFKRFSISLFNNW